jgi:hypothetical protein
MMSDRRYDAQELLKSACLKRQVRFTDLVADTGLWAHPETHRRQLSRGSAAVYPQIRRARIGQGEQRDVKNGEGFDDNSYANITIKRALGMHRSKIIGFECCHIWPNSCYDARYHTVIANLVLLPRALASFSDHDPEVQAALQYRSFELYGWHPDDTPVPHRPDDYPMQWRSPEPDPGAPTMSTARPNGIGNHPAPSPARAPDGPVSIERLRLWAARPHSNVHRIIDIVHRAGSIQRQQLIREIERLGISRNVSGAVASLMTNAGNAYGRALIENAGFVAIHPQIVGDVRRYWGA